MGTSLKWKNSLPEGGSEFFHLRPVPYGMENQYYHIRWLPLNNTIFITHVRNRVVGATPMDQAMKNECYAMYNCINVWM